MATRQNDIVEEIWKPVVGFEETHAVSSLGRVRSLKKDRFVSMPQRPSGYHAVAFVPSINRQKVIRVHQLVCHAFHGPAPEGYHACHLNGDHLDNRADNLRWASPKVNGMHRSIHRRARAKAQNNSSPDDIAVNFDLFVEVLHVALDGRPMSDETADLAESIMAALKASGLALR